MSIGAGVCYFIAFISAIMWSGYANQPDKWENASVSATATILFLGSGGWLWFRHRYSKKTTISKTSYVVVSGLILTATASLVSTAIIVPQAQSTAQAGQVNIELWGQLEGEDDIIGPWKADDVAAVISTDYPETYAVVYLAANSSRPEFDVAIELANGAVVDCRSEKRVNWTETDDGLSFRANCDAAIPNAELQTIANATLTSR